MRFPYGETVTWHAWSGGAEGAPVLDEYGAPITGSSPESTFTDTDVEHVAVAEASVLEPRDGVGFRLMESGTLYFSPALAGLGPNDQFTVRGERYEVEGASGLAVWRHPRTGATPGAAVTIKRVTG